MVAPVVRVLHCRCDGRISFSALQLIEWSRRTVSLKVDTDGPGLPDPISQGISSFAYLVQGTRWLVVCDGESVT